MDATNNTLNNGSMSTARADSFFESDCSCKPPGLQCDMTSHCGLSAGRIYTVNGKHRSLDTEMRQHTYADGTVKRFDRSCYIEEIKDRLLSDSSQKDLEPAESVFIEKWLVMSFAEQLATQLEPSAIEWFRLQGITVSSVNAAETQPEINSSCPRHGTKRGTAPSSQGLESQRSDGQLVTSSAEPTEGGGSKFSSVAGTTEQLGAMRTS